MARKVVAHELPAEWIAWLREHYRNLQPREIHAAFNAHFGTDLPWEKIRDAAKRHKVGHCRGKSIFTSEEQDWLYENYPRNRRAETARLFRERFGRERTVGQITRFAHNKKLCSAFDGRYGKGHRSTGADNWKKMIASPNSQKHRFKKGQKPANERPMFSERMYYRKNRGTQGDLLIKVPIPDPYRPGKDWSWIRKAVWVWKHVEKREIPEGHVIALLDGDPENCAIENLVCVHRSVLVRLNTPWSPKPGTAEVNKVRMRMAQLGVLAQERGKEGK